MIYKALFHLVLMKNSSFRSCAVVLAVQCSQQTVPIGVQLRDVPGQPKEKGTSTITSSHAEHVAPC